MRRIAQKLLSLFRPPPVAPDESPPPPVAPATISRQPVQSIDHTPWEHPWLTRANLSRLRRYSSHVWDFALEQQRQQPRPFSAAFTVNMAQSMYKWALLAKEAGVPAELYCHPLDATALSLPQWEEFDGEFPEVLNGAGFLAAHPDVGVQVPTHTLPVDNALVVAHNQFRLGNRDLLHRLLADSPTLRHEAFLSYPGVGSYFTWVAALARHDVIYTTSAIPGYLTGRPYLAFSPGGDLQFDCGRPDWLGEITGLAYNAARFITMTNPDKLAHLRRFGFTNGLYLPYVMDDHRYCPGPGRAREEWEQRFGPGVYVLATARIDQAIKGNGDNLFDAIREVVALRPSARFVFLSWGHDAQRLQQCVHESGLGGRIIFLMPVGKKRLIDYYRSCDFVLDQFVYGYYGATGQEAAAVGKPILMRICKEHYEPLYDGDLAPVDNAAAPDEIRAALIRLIDDPGYREVRGQQMRQWSVRNHGAQRWAPLMLALLHLTAMRAPLPNDLRTPLLDPLSEEELGYHTGCRLAAA